MPSLGILSEQSQLSAFPQSPAHTSSACGADPPSQPVCPLALAGSVPHGGLCHPWGQQGWQPGLLVGAQPPALPSVLPGGSPGWESPGQGCSHCAFPTGMLPPGSPCPQGGWGDATPRPPPPLTPAEMKDGPGAPGIPQPPPPPVTGGVNSPPLNPSSCVWRCLVNLE